MKRAKNLAIILTAILALNASRLAAAAAPPVPINHQLVLNTTNAPDMIDVSLDASHEQWTQVIKDKLIEDFFMNCKSGDHSAQCRTILRGIGAFEFDRTRMRIQLADRQSRQEETANLGIRTFTATLIASDGQEYLLWGRYQISAIPVLHGTHGTLLGFYVDTQSRAGRSHAASNPSELNPAEAYYVLKNSAGEVVMRLMQN